ncbi:MAG TPA: SRPBCC family protein [Candidatus Dormibacteraeota bacterium]|nr:SRPBCC family protein [Candidatus Dormibacteraeota bacterium]
MARIREEVAIAAPADMVWDTVHQDLRNAPRWAAFVRRAEPIDGRLGKGSRLRYELDLPGGVQTSLVLRPSTWDRPRRCAGRFVEGPFQGTWSYTYEEGNGSTRVVYEMDYRLGGLMRLAGGRLVRQYEEGIRRTMASLKEYVEAQKARPQRPVPPARGPARGRPRGGAERPAGAGRPTEAERPAEDGE